MEVENESDLKSTVKSTVKIINLIKENPYITRQEMSDSLKMSIEGIDKNIKKLKSQNIIRRIGADKGGQWEIITDITSGDD
ncbi:MAG: winged helix-turn-helix transcriptional regulator [Spirochaetales bacterium]|nr:winged helix-turn-helix transcriptional regulator [Spirochaetales bacterium]